MFLLKLKKNPSISQGETGSHSEPVEPSTKIEGDEKQGGIALMWL